MFLIPFRERTKSSTQKLSESKVPVAIKEELFLPVEFVTSIRPKIILIIIFDMVQRNKLHCHIFAVKSGLEYFCLSALTQLGLQFWLEVAFITSKINRRLRINILNIKRLSELLPK